MKKIKTGKVELPLNEFNPKKGKFRVNMFVDLDVIDSIRKRAAEEHMPYQTWINRKLREVVQNESPPGGVTLADIERLIDERLEERVDKKVLKRA